MVVALDVRLEFKADSPCREFETGVIGNCAVPRPVKGVMPIAIAMVMGLVVVGLGKGFVAIVPTALLVVVVVVVIGS